MWGSEGGQYRRKGGGRDESKEGEKEEEGINSIKDD